MKTLRIWSGLNHGLFVCMDVYSNLISIVGQKIVGQSCFWYKTLANTDAITSPQNYNNFNYFERLHQIHFFVYFSFYFSRHDPTMGDKRIKLRRTACNRNIPT